MEAKVKKVPDWSMVAEIEVSYKSNIKPSERIKIGGVKDTYKLLRSIWNPNTIELKESCKVILLNAGKVQGVYELASGGIDTLMVDPRILFTVAIKTKSTAMILSHNHPSGNLKPSDNDIMTTFSLMKAGKLLHVKILDHIILSKDGFYSFAHAGLMQINNDLINKTNSL